MGRLWRRVTLLLSRRRLEREMDEEIAFHLEMKARAYEEDGHSRDEAFAAARRRFGNPLRTHERCEEFWGWRWLHDLATDIRVGSRVLARRPAFTATAIVSLTLGIGAVVTIFTIVHSVLLRPLPYRDPDRLVQVWAETPRLAGMAATTVPDYVAWRAGNRLFDAMGAVDSYGEVNLTGGGFDVLACPGCGARMRLVATIAQRAVVDRILRHLGLPTEMPVPASACRGESDATSYGEASP